MHTLSREEYNEKRKATMEEKKREIIDIAQELFLEKGLDNVTMSHIMKASDTSRATMYRYFDSIHPIVFEVQYRMMKEIFRDLGEADFSGLTAMECGYTGMNILVDHFCEHIDAYNYISMFDHFYAASYPDEKMSNEYASFLMHLFGDAASIDDKWQDHGEMLTYANVIFSYLQKIAHRKKNKIENIDFSRELASIRQLIAKVYRG